MEIWLECFFQNFIATVSQQPFFVYVAVNMCMVLGLIPIVGAPLPILSYGGSSMMAMMLGLGIAMSCKIHKDPINKLVAFK